MGGRLEFASRAGTHGSRSDPQITDEAGEDAAGTCGRWTRGEPGKRSDSYFARTDTKTGHGNGSRNSRRFSQRVPAFGGRVEGFGVFSDGSSPANSRRDFDRFYRGVQLWEPDAVVRSSEADTRPGFQHRRKDGRCGRRYFGYRHDFGVFTARF